MSLLSIDIAMCAALEHNDGPHPTMNNTAMVRSLPVHMSRHARMRSCVMAIRISLSSCFSSNALHYTATICVSFLLTQWYSVD